MLRSIGGCGSGSLRTDKLKPQMCAMTSVGWIETSAGRSSKVAVGIGTGVRHAGHRATFPAASSGAVADRLHPGHTTANWHVHPLTYGPFRSALAPCTLTKSPGERVEWKSCPARAGVQAQQNCGNASWGVSNAPAGPRSVLPAG
jgi:hypothetical protein